MKFPRTVMLYEQNKKTTIFEFSTQEEYDAVVGQGRFEEDPSKWRSKDVGGRPSKEVMAEREKPENLECECGYVGKNYMALKAHRLFGHGKKPKVKVKG